MQKRPWLIAVFATVLWLGIGFCLGGAKAGSARSPAVVMLGDSITAAADWNPLLPSFDVAVVGITVSFSENVIVTGSPTLSLNDGGTATYLSGSGTNALVFGYSVLVGQYTPNLAVTAFNLPNGATVKAEVCKPALFQSIAAARC